MRLSGRYGRFISPPVLALQQGEANAESGLIGEARRGLEALGWAGLGWAGLGWAGLGWAGLGWVEAAQESQGAKRA